MCVILITFQIKNYIFIKNTKNKKRNVNLAFELEIICGIPSSFEIRISCNSVSFKKKLVLVTPSVNR